MIQYVNSSLFDSPAQTLVNTVNTVGVMGKGVAAEFKRRYPEMYRAYRDVCKDGLLTIGKLQLYRSPNKWVLNFPTKQDWRQPSRLEWIEAGLEKFVSSYTAQGITSVAFPMLGCGNGQLDWKSVRPLMERHLTSVRIPVFVHLHVSKGRPEHLPVSAIAAGSRERETVSFLKFWNDVRRAAGADPVANLGPDEADDAAVPLPLEGDRTARLPRLAFEDLYHQLRLRGALRPGQFPDELLEFRDEVSQLLLQLPYVSEIEFQLPPEKGVQYSPREQAQPESSFAFMSA